MRNTKPVIVTTSRAGRSRIIVRCLFQLLPWTRAAMTSFLTICRKDMSQWGKMFWVFLAISAFASESLAHYMMLLPATESGQREEPITVVFQWGHPFEHQL